MNSADYDWERFWIHSIFGALVGAVVGALFCARTGLFSWFWFGAFSLGVAVLGGIYGDRFWERFLEMFGWARWW